MALATCDNFANCRAEQTDRAVVANCAVFFVVCFHLVEKRKGKTKTNLNLRVDIQNIYVCTLWP